VIRIKRLVWLGVCCAALSRAGAAQIADPDPNRFANEIANFATWDSKNAVPNKPILFVGSSSIRIWRTHESFPDLPVINRGFGGAHISDVIHFADRIVLPYKPRLIVFYAGDNDIAADKSAPRVLNDYRHFVDLVRRELPATPIVFLSIKPSGSRWGRWPEMQKANRMIRDFCQKDETLFFADVGTPLLTAEGPPDDGLFRKDRLHLNAMGYALWTRHLQPILRAVLSPNAQKRP
jgi:lysophospholipase L1-like esterase